MTRKLAVFIFEIDFDSLNRSEQEILKALHYRGTGLNIPVHLGKGISINNLNPQSDLDFFNTKRAYAQVWMNKIFLFMDLSIPLWKEYLNPHTSVFGEKKDLENAIIKTIDRWWNLPLGTKLRLPNPYFKYIENDRFLDKYIPGGRERINISGLEYDEFINYYSFLSRFWVPVGKSLTARDRLNEKLDANPGVSLHDQWSLSFLYQDRKPNTKFPADTIKFGLGGFSIIERGIPSISPFALDGRYGFLSPQYLYNPVEQKLCGPDVFTSIRSIDKYSGSKIKQSYNSTIRFSPQLIYAGRFVMEYKEVIPINAKDIRMGLVDPDSQEFISHTKKSLSLEMNPIDLSLKRWITYSSSDKSYYELPELLEDWVNGNIGSNSSLLQNFIPYTESTLSRIVSKPLVFSSSPNELPLSQRKPQDAIEKQPDSSKVTFRLNDSGNYWAVL